MADDGGEPGRSGAHDPEPGVTAEGTEQDRGPGALSPAFDALGHETRLAIVEALADERREQFQPKGLSFSDLRKAVGVRDAGQFNDHLDKLRGRFVSQTDEEYVLRNAGLELAWAVRAGRFDGPPPARAGTVDTRCPLCPEPLEVTYEFGYLRAICPDHGHMFATILPPAAVEGRTIAEAYRLRVGYGRWQTERARKETSPHCWGHVAIAAPAECPSEFRAAPDRPEGEVEQTLARFDGADCGLRFFLPVGICVLQHPAVVAYYHERGIDVTERGFSAVPHVAGSNREVLSEDPVRIAVVVATPAAETGCRVTLDETTAVVDVTEVEDPELPRPNLE